MELFVCSSNYQLLNAIMIIREYRIDADLIVTRESIWSECKLDILSEEKIFHHIYKWTFLLETLADDKIKKPSDKIKIQTKKIITYLNKKRIWNSLPNKDNQYTRINIAYIDSITLWIYTYFKKTGASLSLYEDGTYSYSFLEVEQTFIRKIMGKILYGKTNIEECARIYVKHPEKLRRGSHNVKILKIEENYDSDVLARVLLPLYNSTEESMKSFEKKVIYFDQNIELDEVKNIQKKIASETAQIFGRKNVLIKLHPSSRNIDYGKDIIVFKERLPFELAIIDKNMNNKVLISIFSTACMTPKLDFNQEPYIIFTYKLYGNSFSINEKYLEQIDQLTESYNDKSKVKVPNSMDEYMQMIKLIGEKMI